LTANTITLVNPGGGEVRTYDVTTDAGRQQLPRVEQDDNLTEFNMMRGPALDGYLRLTAHLRLRFDFCHPAPGKNLGPRLQRGNK